MTTEIPDFVQNPRRPGRFTEADMHDDGTKARRKALAKRAVSGNQRARTTQGRATGSRKQQVARGHGAAWANGG